MLFPLLLDTIVADGMSLSAKVYNEHLLAPLVFGHDKIVQELEPNAMISVPIIQDDKFSVEDIDSLLVELLSRSRRCARFDVLNSEPKNLRHFIIKAVQDFKEQITVPITKVAVIGEDFSLVEEPFRQLLRGLEYVKFIESPLIRHQILLVPLDIKCGAVVRQGKNEKRFGIVLYEDCVKRLLFYSDDDLSLLLEHLLVDLDSGEL